MNKFRYWVIITLLVIAWLFGSFQPVRAVSIWERFGLDKDSDKPERKGELQQQQIRLDRRLTITPNPAQEVKKNWREEWRLFWQKRSLVKGVVESISGLTLPAEVVVKNKDDVRITLKITSETKIVRRYGGVTAFGDIKVGHEVSGMGIWVDGEKTIQETKVLRDLSLQKRRATLWGKITAVNLPDRFSIETGQRGQITVTVDSQTKIVGRDQTPYPLNSLAVNHRLRVSGWWDEPAGSMAADLIKDWSLGPLKLTPTAVPTAI